MQDYDEITIVLAPERVERVAPGSTIIEASCGHRAWVSPTGRKALAKNKSARTKCTDCIDAHTVFSGFVAPVPGSIEEVASATGRSVKEVQNTFFQAVRKHGGTVPPRG